MDPLPEGAVDTAEDFRELGIARRHVLMTWREDLVVFTPAQPTYSKPTPDGKNLVLYDAEKRFLASVRIKR